MINYFGTPVEIEDITYDQRGPELSHVDAATFVSSGRRLTGNQLDALTDELIASGAMQERWTEHYEDDVRDCRRF